MTGEVSHDEFRLQSGGAALLDRVEPLWQQLRRHHADLSPRWRDDLLSGTFANRRAALLQKSAGGMLVSIAIHGDKDVGYCVTTISADVGEVDSLFVMQAHRGRGIGDALMNESLAWLQKRSGSIVVDVLSGNEAAIRFYARYGFAPRTTRLMRIDP
jgi:ribosomal protein S18 acetylase RimI-like enzyme